MRHRISRGHAVVVLALSTVLLTASAALADTRALWHMDETSVRTMYDSSPYANHLTDMSASVVLGKPPIFSGTAYGFNGIDSHVRALADYDSLDPGDQDIRISAWVRLVGPIQDDSYDVVRKGLGTSVGGDWKMEIKNFQNLGAVGKLKCSFRGSSARVSKMARPDIMDGAGHHLECIKTATSIIAVVDGRRYTKTVTVGTIANDGGVIVGAKVAGDDVFNGDIDEIQVDIGPTA
jgi:hypothetical protein